MAHSERHFSQVRSTAPLGVKIICVLGAVGVLLSLLESIIALAASPILGLFLFALTLGNAAVLWGLWTVRPWAWTWAVGLRCLLGVVALLTFDVLGVLIDLVFVGYLLTVRDVYRAARH